MSQLNLKPVVDVVVRRAQHQGYVVRGEVRAELDQAGLPASHWKDVVEQAGTALRYQHGRYYFGSPAAAAVRKDRRQQERIHRTVRQLIRRCRSALARDERRGQDRIDFIQPVEVRTEDGDVLTLLSRDLSLDGLRLIAGHSLLGKKIRVFLADDSGGEAWGFVVRIVWTCAVGSGLYENGGIFLETLPKLGRTFKVVCGD